MLRSGLSLVVDRCFGPVLLYLKQLMWQPLLLESHHQLYGAELLWYEWHLFSNYFLYKTISFIMIIEQVLDISKNF